MSNSPEESDQEKLAAQRAHDAGFKAMRGIFADPKIHDSSIVSSVNAYTTGMTAEQISSFIRGLQSADSSDRNRIVPDFRE